VRLQQLDGVRGVAVILVLLGHLVVRSEPGPFLQHALADVTASGWIGVELFFVLSGFLITGILWDARGREGAYRRFITRRALRIFPLYYATVLLLLLVPRWIGFGTAADHARLVANQPWYWTYTTNFLLGIYQSTGDLPYNTSHFWTLAVEEQFYVLWPFLVLTLSSRTLRRICVAALPVCAALRLALNVGLHNPMAAYAVSPARVDSLLVGAWLALTVREAGGLARLARLAPRVLAGAAVVIAVLALPQHRVPNFSLPGQVIGFPALACAFASFIVLSLSSRRVARATSASVLRTFGKYSYALYVFHYPVIAFFQAKGWTFSASLPGAGTAEALARTAADVAVQGGATFALALLSWNLLESPFLRLKRLAPMPSDPAAVAGEVASRG
jgi:peptidoglycan/LPS O-acetylase OafA/YrhL